jgi:signal transduction histidine kinase
MAGYVFAAACAALVCACYLAGRAALPRRWTAAVAAGALCVPAAQFAIRPAGLPSATGFVCAYLVFAALPLLAGRYVAAQRQVAEQERLRERLAIARDMHDSLGRRLSLAAVAAAGLEVSGLPEEQHVAVTRLADAVRASVTELHEIVGVLRSDRGPDRRVAAIGGLIEEFRAMGAEVSMCESGTPWRLPPHAGDVAYRVIEEALTNAVRHAPGQPVALTIEWKPGTLLLTAVNPAAGRGGTPGSGLADLAGRLRRVGGSLDHELAGGRFRLQAALPSESGTRRARLPRAVTVGLAAGVLLLVILPAAVLLGVR